MTAVALIEAAELRLPQNSLTCAIDRTGQYYRVPIACINLPNNFGRNEELQRMKDKKSPKQKNINIKIRYQHKDIEFKISNKETVAGVK